MTARPPVHVTEQRKAEVAALLGRGILIPREINYELTRRGVINPETNLPYSERTIAEDARAIRAEWKEAARADYEDHLATSLMRTDQVYKEAMNAGDLTNAVAALRHRDKVLGLDKGDLTVIAATNAMQDVKLIVQQRRIELQETLTLWAEMDDAIEDEVIEGEHVEVEPEQIPAEVE